jgi:hypothetical protein
MFTVDQIYQRLVAGTAGVKMPAFTEPVTPPGTGTMHTLNEVMAKAPAPDNLTGVTTTNVLTGTTFWGVNAAAGQWGPQTGAAPLGADVSGANGLRTFPIPDGFYLGKSASATDTKLVAGNLLSGVSIFGVLGTYPFAAVAKTGQTTSYASGDDGALQKGAVTPSPRFTELTRPLPFIESGTVQDNRTGLIWLKNANCPNTTRDWATALADVAALNSTGTMAGNDCGDFLVFSHHTDWRLPNLRELETLIDYGQANPAFPAVSPFTNVQNGRYWSSTTVANNTPNAWDIDFTIGTVNRNQPKVGSNFSVWPVRGGQ